MKMLSVFEGFEGLRPQTVGSPGCGRDTQRLLCINRKQRDKEPTLMCMDVFVLCKLMCDWLLVIDYGYGLKSKHAIISYCCYCASLTPHTTVNLWRERGGSFTWHTVTSLCLSLHTHTHTHMQTDTHRHVSPSLLSSFLAPLPPFPSLSELSFFGQSCAALFKVISNAWGSH